MPPAVFLQHALPKFSRISLVVLACALCHAPGRSKAADGAPDSPGALLKALKAAPFASLRNIKAAGSVKVSKFDAQTNEFDEANTLVFSEIVDTTGSGRFWLDLNPSITPWQGGTPPFSVKYESYSFNGKFGIQATYKEGVPGKIFDYHDATVTAAPDSTTGLYLRWAMGGFATPLLKIEEERGLLDLLANPIYKRNDNSWQGCVVSVRPETVEGRPLLRVEFKDYPVVLPSGEVQWVDPASGSLRVGRMKAGAAFPSSSVETLWLDPARGFLLVRRIWSNGWEYVIDDAKEVAKGLWLPTSGVFTVRINGKLEQTVNLKIGALEVNVPGNDDTYTAEIKPDSHVEDQRYGISFDGKDVPSIPSKLKDDETLKKQ
jgi:hypothetical protein